ncbi:unnamed protein product [Diamesa serratosioi]
MAETSFRKSKRRSTKESYVEESLCRLNIVINITKIGNLKNFEYGEESEFEISLKYLTNVVNCKNLNESISEATKRFKVLGKQEEESVNLEYILQLNFENNDVFDLASYPAEISLIQHHKDGKKSILGYTSLDFYPLITNQIERRVFNLYFERDEDPENKLPLFRKPYIALTVSTDQPIIQEPNTVVNSMMITVDSIFNMSSSCTSVEVGFIVPFEAKNLKKEEIEMLENITIEDTIQFNSIARVILSRESVLFLYDHIRNNKKLAVEVIVDERHLIGFVDLEELVHVNRKKIHTVVPLTQFTDIALQNNCGYSSAFGELGESKKPRTSKKSVSMKKFSSFRTSTADDTEVVSPEILSNADGNPTFLILEIGFQKPLNEEVPVEIENLLPNKSDSHIKRQGVKYHLKDNFRMKIKAHTKNLFKVYEQEGNLEKIFSKTVSNGFIGKFLDSLMVDICEIAKEEFNSFSLKSNEHFLSTLMCDITSMVLNETKIESDNQTNKLLAKVYYELNMKERSNNIFLKRMLDENCSEASWISYGIHNLRSLNFNEAYVCFEESLAINNRSLLGNILISYISFKQQKYNECERLLNFIVYLNPGLLEVEFMKHLLNVKLSREEIPFLSEDLKSHEEFDEIYNEREILWFSTPENSFLNFQNHYIKVALFCIKLGCYEFAELALAEYFLHFGANVNYLYLMAVIDAMRDEHENTLIHLNKIGKMDIGNHAVNVCLNHFWTRY